MSDFQSSPLRSKTDFTERYVEHTRKVSGLQNDMMRIVVQIQELEGRKSEIQKLLLSANKEFLDLETEFHHSQLQEIQSSLLDCQEKLHEFDKVCSQISQIQKERQTYFQLDPALQKDLNEYLTFAAQAKAIINSLQPSFYRQSLEDAHRKMEQRVSPIINLNEREHGLLAGCHLNIQIYIARNPLENVAMWILPVRLLEIAPQQETRNGIAFDLFNSLIYFEADPDWHITATFQAEWCGFFVYSIKGEAVGEKGLVQTTKDLLLDLLPGSLLVVPSLIDIHVEEIPWNIWLVGQEQSKVKAEILTSEVSAITVFEQKVADLSSLFTQRDVASWERPLKTSTKSNWNVSGRRLRTLLMRLIAKGYVGTNGTIEDFLWRGLPDSHISPIKDVIPLLTESGLLTSYRSEDLEHTKISINPAMLHEVQALINRDVTSFWINLIH